MQMQRTILWIVFSMSLLFLWDSWQRHNGKPSMFGGPTTTQGEAKSPADAKAGAGAGSAPDASIPSAPASTVGATPAAAGTPAGAVPAGKAAPAAELVQLRSDVLALDIDPVGGQVSRAELLKHKLGSESSGKGTTENIVLLYDQPGNTFTAQSGLVGAPQGETYPTHKTTFTVVDGPRPIDGGGVEVKLAAEGGGLKLVRSYRLAPGSYVLETTDAVTNAGQRRTGHA